MRRYYANELFYVTLDPASARSPPFPYGLNAFAQHFRDAGSTSAANNVVLLLTPALGQPMSLTNADELVAAVKAKLVPGLEFLHVSGSSATDRTVAAQLAHRAVVLMGPSDEWLENALFMRHRAGTTSVDDALAKEFDSADWRGLGGLDRTPVTGTPAVIEFNKRMSADTSGYYGYRNCYMSLATSLGLRYFHTTHSNFPRGYDAPFAANVTVVLDALEQLGVIVPPPDRPPSATPSVTPTPLPIWRHRGPCDPVAVNVTCDVDPHSPFPEARHFMPCLNASGDEAAASAGVDLCVVNNQWAVREHFAVAVQHFDPRTQRLLIIDGKDANIVIAPTAITLYRLPQGFVHGGIGVVATGHMYLRFGAFW